MLQTSTAGTHPVQIKRMSTDGYMVTGDVISLFENSTDIMFIAIL